MSPRKFQTRKGTLEQEKEMEFIWGLYKNMKMPKGSRYNMVGKFP
jgi:hypothetical protein